MYFFRHFFLEIFCPLVGPKTLGPRMEYKLKIVFFVYDRREPHNKYKTTNLRAVVLRCIENASVNNSQRRPQSLVVIPESLALEKKANYSTKMGYPSYELISFFEH